MGSSAIRSRPRPRARAPTPDCPRSHNLIAGQAASSATCAPRQPRCSAAARATHARALSPTLGEQLIRTPTRSRPTSSADLCAARRAHRLGNGGCRSRAQRRGVPLVVSRAAPSFCTIYTMSTTMMISSSRHSSSCTLDEPQRRGEGQAILIASCNRARCELGWGMGLDSLVRKLDAQVRTPRCAVPHARQGAPAARSARFTARSGFGIRCSVAPCSSAPRRAAVCL